MLVFLATLWSECKLLRQANSKQDNPLLRNFAAAVAVAGVTVLASGFGSEADASPLAQNQEFLLSAWEDKSLSFNTFDSSLGTLTGVTLDLDSFISFAGSANAVTRVLFRNQFGTEISSIIGGGDYDFTELDLTAFPGISLNDFSGDSGTAVTIFLSGISIWNGDSANGYNGLTLNYIYDETPSQVPLPAGFPLMLGGLAAFGFVARRRGR